MLNVIKFEYKGQIFTFFFEKIYNVCNYTDNLIIQGSSFLIPQLNIVVEVGHEGRFFIMEKVAFIIDGGFFAKQYKKIYKKFPTADDVENYILKVFEYLKEKHSYSIEIYRIFYYDCPPLHNLKRMIENRISQPLKKSEKEICESFEKKYNIIKKFHDQMKRKDFFALRMGKLKFQGWEKINSKYGQPKIKQKGVDMRIGLDIASITTKKLCTKLVLISGDTDMVPAMKMARKEGVHVYWHSMDDGRKGSNLDLATHSDVVITNELLKLSNPSSS